jgi:short-subunit dehydrogenase
MKQTVIVGGGGALGSALVARLLDENHRVVVAGRTEPADQRIGNFYSVDATSLDWPTLYSMIEKQSGQPIDAFVFVAGTAVFGKTALIPVARARQTFELNFWACTAAAKAAAEYWDVRHQGGVFVAVLSIVARVAVPFEAYYSASKAATARFLECLQLEYGHKRIEFVCAYPGMLKTPFRREAEWYGFEQKPSDEGADVRTTAQAITRLLEGRRKARVIGWRERSIDLADRWLPGLYDRVVLRPRVQRILK